MPVALYALALASFAVCTAEFVVSGLLPDLSGDLSVSIPVAGLLVSAYAVAVAIGGPILAVLTARYPRKPTLLAMLAVFTIGQILCALASSYPMLLAARVFVACCHGVFFGIASVAAASLVPPKKRGLALSVFFSGITLANLLGMPAGTALGNAFGWRMAFWGIFGMGLAALVALAAMLPKTGGASGTKSSLRSEFRALKTQQIWLGYLIIAVLMTGILCFTTYQVPLLEQVTGIPIEWVPAYLLLAGAGSVGGVLVGGRLADWKLMPSLVGILLAQGLVQLAILAVLPSPGLMAVGMFVFGLIGFAFNAPMQSRILGAAAAAPNLAATLVSTAFNVGIAAGAWVGSAMLAAGLGYETLPMVSAACSFAAAGIAALSWSLDRSRAAAMA
jgi:DHA1 family inner membrane transport protein